MKKISEWLKELPEPYRGAALKNFELGGWPNNEVENLHVALTCAFNWLESPEGFYFWDEVAFAAYSSDGHYPASSPSEPTLPDPIKVAEQRYPEGSMYEHERIARQEAYAACFSEHVLPALARIRELEGR